MSRNYVNDRPYTLWLVLVQNFLSSSRAQKLPQFAFCTFLHMTSVNSNSKTISHSLSLALLSSLGKLLISHAHMASYHFNMPVLRIVCVCVVVTALRVNRMSKRRASNLIKKEIKVDVCYFQLHHSTAICQSQRCDCFGPTVIHCLSKY